MYMINKLTHLVIKQHTLHGMLFSLYISPSPRRPLLAAKISYLVTLPQAERKMSINNSNKVSESHVLHPTVNPANRPNRTCVLGTGPEAECSANTEAARTSRSFYRPKRALILDQNSPSRRGECLSMPPLSTGRKDGRFHAPCALRSVARRQPVQTAGTYFRAFNTAMRAVQAGWSASPTTPPPAHFCPML